MLPELDQGAHWDGWGLRPGEDVRYGGDEFHARRLTDAEAMEKAAKRLRADAGSVSRRMALRAWSDVHAGEIGYCAICGRLTGSIERAWDDRVRGMRDIRSCGGGFAGRHIGEFGRCDLIRALRAEGFTVDSDAAVRRINELLRMPEAAWAKASLEGTREMILRTDRVTGGQRRAIENIDKAVARRV